MGCTDLMQARAIWCIRAWSAYAASSAWSTNAICSTLVSFVFPSPMLPIQLLILLYTNSNACKSSPCCHVGQCSIKTVESRACGDIVTVQCSARRSPLAIVPSFFSSSLCSPGVASEPGCNNPPPQLPNHFLTHHTTNIKTKTRFNHQQQAKTDTPLDQLTTYFLECCRNHSFGQQISTNKYQDHPNYTPKVNLSQSIRDEVQKLSFCPPRLTLTVKLCLHVWFIVFLCEAALQDSMQHSVMVGNTLYALWTLQDLCWLASWQEQG